MNTELETEKPEVIDLPDQCKHTSETRRRLLRAGLAAAPVLLAVKSRSVLACGSYGGGLGVKCRVTCSAFASIKAATRAGTTLSHHPGSGHSCKSHEEWKNCAHPHPYSEKHNCYFHAKSYKPKRNSFHTGSTGTWNTDHQYLNTSNPYSIQSNCRYANFAVRNSSNVFKDRTLQEMLHCTTNSLAVHLVATILNKAGGLDSENILPDAATCRTIWNGDGIWTPSFAGATPWTKADTIAWFNLCYGTCLS